MVESNVVDQPTVSRNELPVLPRVRQWNPGQGSFTVGSTVRVRVDQDDLDSLGAEPPVVRQSVAEVLETFAADLATLGVTVERVSAAADLSLALVPDPSLGLEGYEIRIAPDAVALTAPSSAGLFYATRTLLQLAASLDGQLPVGTIRDTPDIAHRFLLLDAGRKYWQIDYLKDLLRQMAAVKLNTLHLHLVEAEGFRLYSDRYPGLSDPDVAYSESQIKDLVEFARRLQIDIVPGFEFPGHATVVSEYFGIGMGQGSGAAEPEHMHSHLSPNWALDFTSDAGWEISKELLETFVPWFTSPYVHLGGDELPGELGGCQRVKSYVAQTDGVQNLGDALVVYLNELDLAVRGLGKTSIVYNGVENMSPTCSLNPDIMVMDWQGEGTDPYFDGHQILTSNVDYAYVCPNNYGYHSSGIDYITRKWDIRAGDRFGAGISIWCDYTMWAPDEFFERHMALTRAVLADRVWNTAKPAGEAIVARARALPMPPRYQGFAPFERVGAEQPRHHYSFGYSHYPPGFHWAGSPGNTLMVADSTGRLHGSSYILWNPVVVPDERFGSAWRFENNNCGVGFGGLDIAPPWTFMAWVKVSEWVADAALMASFGGEIRLVEGAVVLVDANGHRVELGAEGLSVGRWTRVAIVAEPESTALYLDGVPTARAPGAMDLPMMSIGNERDRPMFRGEIAEMAIYDAALSHDRLVADAGCGSAAQ